MNSTAKRLFCGKGDASSSTLKVFARSSSANLSSSVFRRSSALCRLHRGISVFSTRSVHNHHIEMILFAANMNLERNARAARDFSRHGRYRLPRKRGFRYIHRERPHLSCIASATNVGSIGSRRYCLVQRFGSARAAETRSSPMRGMR